jgi:hypothetical protein
VYPCHKWGTLIYHFVVEHGSRCSVRKSNALKRSRLDEQGPDDTGNMQKEARHHYSIAAFCLLSEQSYLQRHRVPSVPNPFYDALLTVVPAAIL